MREIKFRAWDNDVMLYDVWPVGDTLYDPHGGFWRSLRNPVMQFTGLKDKNGKEIYEGDIVEATTRSGQPGLRGVMEWENSEAGWTKLHPIGQFEVIGNIYENAELLKQ